MEVKLDFADLMVIAFITVVAAFMAWDTFIRKEHP